MDNYNDLVTCLMFSLCLTTNHLHKTRWLATLIDIHMLLYLVVVLVFTSIGVRITPIDVNPSTFDMRWKFISIDIRLN